MIIMMINERSRRNATGRRPQLPSSREGGLDACVLRLTAVPTTAKCGDFTRPLGQSVGGVQ